MTKRVNFDDAGDSADLQALFDSIAGSPPEAEKPKLEVVEPKASTGSDSDELQSLFDAVADEFETDEVSVGAAAAEAAPEPEPAVAAPAAVAKPAASVPDNGGDSDELQSLFDAVVQESAHQDVAPAADSAPVEALAADATAGSLMEEAMAAGLSPEHSCDIVYQKIGQMTRKVHDALSELGYDQALQDAAEVMPDARQRLNYIAQMTEQAASKVLNATDIAKPMQDRIENGAVDLKSQWDKVFNNQLSADEFKSLAEKTRDFLGATIEDSRGTNAQLTEIMMAQDFQDLTGQVIKRVVEMAQMVEGQLLGVLIETAPEDKKPAKKVTGDEGLMNGPVVQSEGRDDVVTSQEQVDDLLESLGF